MECPSCKHENPESSQFCAECGESLHSESPRVRNITPNDVLRPMSDGPVATLTEMDVASRVTDPPSKKTAKKPQKTMLGVQASDLQIPTPSGAEPQAAKTITAPSPGAGETWQLGAQSSVGSAKTAQMPMAAPTPAAPTPVAPSPSRPKVAVQSKRTMLGVPAKSGAGTREEVSHEVDHVALAGSRQRNRLALLLAGAALFVVVGLGSYFMFRASGELNAKLVNGEAGDVLRIHLPDAEDGTEVRVFGRVAKVLAGDANVPLGPTDLSLGGNEIDVVVGTEQQTVSLDLAHWVRLDRAALKLDPPVIRVLIDSKTDDATLNGNAVALKQGHAEVKLPVPDATDFQKSVFENIVTYQVSGRAGELVVRLPYVTAALHAPLPNHWSSRDELLAALRVEEDATVVANDRTLQRSDASPAYRVGMVAITEDAPSVNIRVTAPGRGARSVDVPITRVRSFSKRMTSADAVALVYPENPETFADGGSLVRFSGQVFNVRREPGGTSIQLLMKPCAKKSCPVWVNYGAHITLAKRTTLRVLGTPAGVQRYRTSKEQTRADPRVNAIAVVTTRKRHR